MNGPRATAVAVLAVLAIAAGSAAHWLSPSAPMRDGNNFSTPFLPHYDQRLVPCGDWHGEPTFAEGDDLDRGGERPLFRLYHQPSFVGPTHIRLYADRIASFHLPTQEEWQEANPGATLAPGEQPPLEAGSAPLDAQVMAHVLVVLESSSAMMDPDARERDVLDGVSDFFSAGHDSCARNQSPDYGTRMGILAELVYLLMEHASLTDPAELAESTTAIRAGAQRVERTALRQH